MPSVDKAEALIERAKSVVVVARRVDEDEADRILLDAAVEAGISVRLAADQIMSALQAGRGGDITQDTLVHALEAVHPTTPHGDRRGAVVSLL